VVYAQEADGTVSPRSAEVAEPQGVPDLRVVSKTARNATLRWGAIRSVPVGDSVGYNVYRRPEGGSYGSEPVGYTGLRDIYEGRQYTDTRLEPDRTYYYKVRARTNRVSDGRYREVGESQEIAVTTESSTASTYTYASLDVAVVIFRNANDRNGGDRQISDEAYRSLKFMLRKARSFYWRNSKMKLNLDFTFYPVEEYVDFGDGGAFSSANQTGEYLRDNFGVTKSQYEIVYMINPATGGNHSFGTIGSDLRLPGPDRGSSGALAYSHHPVSRGGDFFSNGMSYPNRREGGDHIWLFIHEGQHAVDAIYSDNNEPQMGHGDFPELYGNPDVRSGNEPGGYNDFPTNYPEDYPEGYGYRFGKRFDFQARMLREFQEEDQGFEKLLPEWGDIYSVPDQDGDGFPDRDSLVALDEVRFGTSTSTPDGDSDGLTDKQEALAGIYPFPYASSDPSDTDSDGDGVRDGDDKYPRYAGDTTVVETDGISPTVDSDLSEWPDSALVSRGAVATTGGVGDGFSPKVYMAYNSDSLYVAMNPGAVAIPELNFDFDADGRWYGAGNTEIRFDISDERIDQVRSFDARDDVQACLETADCPSSGDGAQASGDGIWDNSSDYQSEFGRRVFTDNDIRDALDLDYPDNVTIELAIPMNEAAGLSLQSGEDIGFYVNYSKVGNQAGEKATAFDPKSFTYVTLGPESVDRSTGPASARESRLAPNYPNPFRRQTTIEYAVKQAGRTTLTVYNLLGRRVKTLTSREHTPGTYTLAWNGRNNAGQRVPSGVYVYRLTTPSGQHLTRKMTVVR
jgi:hypothetical protein